MIRIPLWEGRSVGVLLLILLLVGIFAASREMAALGRPQGPPPSPCFWIEVAGDVQEPGVYGLRQPLTLSGFLKLAGAPERDEAPALQDGLQAPLRSGTSLEVRATPQGLNLSLKEMSGFAKMTLGLPISLNRASAQDLEALPGIGPRLAEAMVIERKRRGGFGTVQELMAVPRIGKRLVERIKPFVEP